MAIERALEIALAHGLGHLAGRAYANLATFLADLHRFERSDAVIAEGLQYTEDHDLLLRSVCLSGVLAESEMKRGRWDDAIADALGRARTNRNDDRGAHPRADGHRDYQHAARRG